ncbi:hypothetical protein LTR08_002145 [Meristemomyces frigidus]|nr:hypothetical protein LTR08_002145 [Meristemomyces frigidus]
MAAFALGVLAIVGVAAAPNKRATPTSLEPDLYTATVNTSVYAAQATAPTAKVPKKYHMGGRSFDRFITIWMENTDYDKAAGDPNLSWLASQGVTLSEYYGVTHPSQPNYAPSVGGDNFGMDNDDFNQINCNVSTVVDLLEERDISWGTYQEDMPYTGYEGFSWVNQKTQANDYVRKHNPPIIYNANTGPQRLAFQKNLTMFYQDLANEDLPQWSFITPNMTNDGHDSSVTVAGTWMRSFLEPLLSNEYFMERTLILVTFDENHTYTIANKVFSFLLGGAVKGLEGTTDSHYYNHYSEISTVEANWDLHTLGRWDVGANVFDVVAAKTNDIYRPNDAVTLANGTIFQNSSFAGPFNTVFAQAAYPAPNVWIKSPKTARTVLPAIKKIWSGMDSYYNNGVVIPDGQHPPTGYAVNDVSN